MASVAGLRGADNLSGRLRKLLAIVAVIAFITLSSAQAQSPIPSPSPVCAKDQFACRDGSCISDGLQCDGKPDCPGGLGEDEILCSGSVINCDADEFFCGQLDGECVKLFRVCDGTIDCTSSGADEANCTCTKTDFQCNNGSCIPRELLCNNVTDCADGEDEGVHQCGCLKSEFFCLDGTCISDTLLCDGKKDCPGEQGEDELVCSVIIPVCSASKFDCGDLDGDCIERLKVCDGVEDCSSGLDEADCPSSGGATCGGAEFECSASSSVFSPVQGADCIPLRQQCDSSFQCANGGDESNCTFPILVQTPTSQNVSDGDTVTLTCVAQGTPTPTVTWLRDLMPLPSDSRYQVTSVNGLGTLTIAETTVFDEGQYSCQVSIPDYSFISMEKAVVSVQNDNPQICTDARGNMYLEGDRFYELVTEAMGDATTAAADIIFVVDESGSMGRAHEWIREVAPLLDDSLKGNGVGAGSVPNKFALVGFGQSNPDTIKGVVLSQLTSVESFVNATLGLSLSGSIEDGYSAIEVALNQIDLRNGSGMARIMVLVTNEDRSTLPGKNNLTRDVIEERLSKAGFVLNVVVPQGFLVDENNVMGVDFNGTCYSLEPDLTVVEHSSCVRDSATEIGDTYDDYVVLAHNLKGAAWDITFIHHLPDLIGFSMAFVDVKVAEVMGLEFYCLACDCQKGSPTCDNVDLAAENCTGIVPTKVQFIVNVSPDQLNDVPVGSNVTLTCDVFISIDIPEDEITLLWVKIGQGPFCDPNDCPRSITLTDVDVGNEGLYICTATARGMQMHDMTFLKTVAPPVIETPPMDTTVRDGKPIEVTCEATGNPPPLVYWVRSDGGPLSNDGLVEGGDYSNKLIIDPATMEDAGQYECVAVNKAGTDRASFTIEVTLAICNVSGMILFPGESHVFFSHDPAADVVLLVDESGSMDTEHEWLKRMVMQLDTTLKEYGIGVMRPNLFASIGFASQYNMYELGRIVSSGSPFVRSSEIDSVLDDLWVDGQREDGYAAIKFALDNLQFRQAAARQFILVTDEDRLNIDSSLNYNSIRDLLRGANTRLNVIVREEFGGQKGVPAFGLDSFGAAYVYYPLAEYYTEAPANLPVRKLSDGASIVGSGYGTTHYDYTLLALELGGAAWDLGLLSRGPPLDDAFASAFVSVEVQEILNQVSVCENCTCWGPFGLLCVPLDPFNGIYPECAVPEFADNILPLDLSLDVQIRPKGRRFPNYGNLNASLECVVNGPDDLTPQWTFRGRELEPNMATSPIVSGVSTLMLTDPPSADSGTYCCFVANVNSTQGRKRDIVDMAGLDSAYLEVYEPFVALEPLQATLMAGGNLSITASISEDGTFNWSFLLNGQEEDTEGLPSNVVVQSTNRTSVLSIMDANEYNIGLYMCDATGSTRSGSDFTGVYVRAPVLEITLDDRWVEVKVGAEAVLTCRVVCACKDVQLKWTLLGGADLPEGVTTDGNGDDVLSLVVSMAELKHDNIYQCVATYRSLEESATGSIKVISDDPIMSSSVMTSSSTQGPEPSSTITSIMSPTSSPTSVTSSVLPTPTSSFVTPPTSSLTTSPMPTTQPDPPSLVLSPDPETEPIVRWPGSAVEVNCTSNINDVAITWLPADGSDRLPDGIVTRMTTPNMSVFTISNITSEHYMTYICSSGAVNVTFTIHKPGSPLQNPVITPNPALGPIETEVGSSVVVKCTSNVPYAVISWHLLRDQADLPEGITTERMGTHTSVFHIEVMTESMYNQYVCQVATSIDPVPLLTSFTISKPDPIRVRAEKNLLVEVEDRINEDNVIEIGCTFQCTVCSGAYLSWSFMHPGGQLPPGVKNVTRGIGRTKDLIFFAGSAHHQTGLYFCSAHASNGTIVHTDILNATILVTARVSVPVRSMTVSRGESAVFRCVSTREATFSWNYDDVDGPLPLSAVPTTISSTESQLNISNVMYGVNTGKYFCTGDFHTGEVMKADADLNERLELDVILKHLPSTEDLDGDSISVAAGSSVSVECTPECGDRCPTAQVAWFVGQSNMEVSRDSTGEVWQEGPVARRRSTLRIRSADAGNAVRYYCRIAMSSESSNRSLTINLQS